MSKSITVTLEPTVLKWARERAGLSIEALARNLTQPEKVAAWESDGRLTLKQAEAVAAKTYTPFGYLYLDAPPVEQLPISDFRTLDNEPLAKPSPELIETLDAAIMRQQWFRDYAIANGEAPLDFVGSLTGEEDIVATAKSISTYFGLDTAMRTQARNYEEAIGVLRGCLEQHGVLVMQSGIAGENTHRALNIQEFRGFALADEYAPLIFINSKDVKAGQIFTQMHELVHLWLGVSGVSNLKNTYAPNRAVEVFCNAVAAEILVPASELLRYIPGRDGLDKGDLDATTRHFKVSSLVIIRRLRDLRLINQEEFETAYKDATERFLARAESGSSGGDYYNTKISRLGKRFLSAVMEDTIEGRMSYKEAFHLSGVGNVTTLRNLARGLDLQP